MSKFNQQNELIACDYFKSDVSVILKLQTITFSVKNVQNRYKRIHHESVFVMLFIFMRIVIFNTNDRAYSETM